MTQLGMCELSYSRLLNNKRCRDEQRHKTNSMRSQLLLCIDSISICGTIKPDKKTCNVHPATAKLVLVLHRDHIKCTGHVSKTQYDNNATYSDSMDPPQATYILHNTRTIMHNNYEFTMLCSRNTPPFVFLH